MSVVSSRPSFQLCDKIHSQEDTLYQLASCPVVEEREREREGGGKLPFETEIGNRYLTHSYFCSKP